MTVYEELVNQVYTSFCASESYDKGYKGAVILVNESQYCDLSLENVFLDIEIRRKSESLPLICLPSAFIAFILSERPSEKLALLLTDAAIYYGFPRFCLDYKHKLVGLASQQKFNILKNIAKAHKNLGEFHEALDIYRSILVEWKDDDSISAYVLALYAKLCGDYYQKQGWHFAFHKIAYERFKKINETPDNERRRFICADSYAKTLYGKDSVRAIKIFKRYYSKYRRQPRFEDALLRLQAHLIECTLERELKEDLPCADSVVMCLEQLQFLPLKASGNSNPRAYYVRKLHFLTYFRKAYNRIGGDVARHFQDLSIEEAFLDVIGECNKYSDWKAEAAAKYEYAMWKSLFVNSHDDILVILKSAAELLSKNVSLSDLYQFISLEQGKLYIQKGQWREAAGVFQETYDRCNTLIEELKNDESSLQSRKTAELFVLRESEVLILKENLHSDYTTLLERSAELSRFVLKFQEEYFGHVALQLKFRYHEVNAHLNNIRYARSLKTVGAFVSKACSDVELWYGRDELFVSEVLDICEEVKNTITHLRFTESENVKIEFFETVGVSSICGTFNKQLLTLLLRELVRNAISTSKRMLKVKLNIKVSVAIESVSISEQICTLVVRDNAGEFVPFKQVIDNLNLGENYESQNGEGRGKGLKLFKDIIERFLMNARERPMWSLSQDGDYKVLEIPISLTTGFVAQ